MGEGGNEVQYLPRMRFSDLQSLPLCRPAHHQSWEVCRGRRRAHRTKAVPSPTSPLLHNTPKAGHCLGWSSSSTALGCGPTLVEVLYLFVSPQRVSDPETAGFSCL